MLVRKIKSVEHRIYNDEKEFNQYCPDENLTRNWRDGTEGSWVMADDGQVCQVLKRGELRDSQSKGVCNYYIRTVIGSFICRDNVMMEGDMRKNMYSFASEDLSPYQHKINRKKSLLEENFFLQSMSLKVMESLKRL